MGRFKDENIRKIQQLPSGSYVLTLPIKLVRKFGWRVGQKVIVKGMDRNRILIRDYWE